MIVDFFFFKSLAIKRAVENYKSTVIFSFEKYACIVVCFVWMQTGL